MAEDLVDPQKDAILEQHSDLGGAAEPDNEPISAAFAIPANLLGEDGAVAQTGLGAVHGEIIGTAVNEETGESIPQYDISCYRWQQNGRKLSKITEKNEILRRQHWRCSNWDKPTKEKGCKAKYRIDIYENGKPASEPYKNEIPHNHLPPSERGKVDMETQLQLAVQPVKRERKRKTATTPTRTEQQPQLEDGDTKRRREAAEVKEAFDRKVLAIQSVIKLFDSYGDNFTRRVDLYPEIRAIFASPKGLEELIKHSTNVFVSSDYIALGLTLVIISVLSTEENAVLWLIANGNEVNNYELMLRYVYDDVAGGRFKPTNLIWKENFKQEVDGPFREAFVKIFPHCNVLMAHPSELDPPPHVPNPAAVGSATTATTTIAALNAANAVAAAASAIVASASLSAPTPAALPSNASQFPASDPSIIGAPPSMIATTILSSLERA